MSGQQKSEILRKLFNRLDYIRRRWTHRAKMKYLIGEYRFKKLIRTRNSPTEEYKAGKLLFEADGTLGPHQWIFHDEDWIRVRGRRQHRRLVAKGLPLNVIDNLQEPTREAEFLPDGTMRFDGRTETDDEWIILYLDPQKYDWENFSWNFRVRRDTRFRELQFAFRYRDFYNRYRYRFEDDYIYFDKHIKGVFYSGFNTVPFRMDLGVSYNVRIDVYGNNFRCYVNDVLMMDEFDFDNELPRGSIAIILWEHDGITDIKGSISSMYVRELTRKQAE
jgi:hypothetical protein